MDNTSITVQLLKPGKGRTIRYTGEILRAEADWVLILAHWERPRTDLGYVVFEPGDAFYEYYYTQRWYNIFEIRTPAGALKGWYCNITRPAVIEANTITSEDLELDLFVSPERTMMLRLDREEFEARGFATHEPTTYTAALAALDQLVALAQAGIAPFDAHIDSAQ
jgi:protein associated with RNAse G/E